MMERKYNPLYVRFGVVLEFVGLFKNVTKYTCRRFLGLHYRPTTVDQLLLQV